ncbi:MAG: glycosyltransferase [Rhodospirillales bacterium]|nr:glycosyltransferase [Rhodospirillales bacterium]
MTPRFVAGAPGVPAGPYDADVVILALDRAEETEQAIASALAQRGVARHVTVLDQGSHPPALARLARCVAGRGDASLWALAENLGVAGGRNAATALGHGRVIAGLDNDAEFAGPATLAGAVAALDRDPGLGAIGLRIVAYDGGRDDPSSWGYPRALLPRAGGSFGTVTFVGAGHAIRRAAWDAAGGYDPALFFCWEEYDFCLRAIAQGWRIGYRGDLVVRHKVAAERRLAWSGERWFLFVRNRIHIARKWGASWPALVPRIAGYLVKGARAGLLAQTWRAIRAAAAMEPAGAPRPLPVAAADYLRRHDGAYRGSPLRRLRQEVMAPPGGA